LYERAQGALRRHNKPRCSKPEIVFCGLLACAHDDCTITTKRKEGKYVYDRRTGYRGKCAAPRFTESEIAGKLGIVLRNIRIPDAILAKPQQSLIRDQYQLLENTTAQRKILKQRLSSTQ
jgi:hypothetical protein